MRILFLLFLLTQVSANLTGSIYTRVRTEIRGPNLNFTSYARFANDPNNRRFIYSTKAVKVYFLNGTMYTKYGDDCSTFSGRSYEEEMKIFEKGDLTLLNGKTEYKITIIPPTKTSAPEHLYNLPLACRNVIPTYFCF